MRHVVSVSIMRTGVLTSILATLLMTAGMSAQTCDDLKRLLDKTYGFKPSKLTREQVDAKSSELDLVWKMVEANQKVLLPCLRSQIDLRKADSFFRFNASNLLSKHDQSLETKKLLVATYSEADLADINLRYWLPPLAGFGREGIDVSRAGETWLRFPKPVYFLPQHGTRPIDKGVGALALFGSMDESVATPVLARLAGEENTDFRSIVIWLLVSQTTPESDRHVRQLAPSLPEPLATRLLADVAKPKIIEARLGTPQTTRDTFIKAMTEFLDGRPQAWNSLTAAVPDGEKDMAAVFNASDLPLVRKMRRAYAAEATPHSPEWYVAFTQIINTLRLKAESNTKTSPE